jgi:CheY-like chemotaxis protein
MSPRASATLTADNRRQNKENRKRPEFTTPPRGGVFVSCLPYTPPGGRINLDVAQREGEVVISVQDNGIGIAAEMIPRLFTLFTQLNRPPAGTQSGLGVGLAIVQRLAALHGGKAEATSAGLGKGATFNVTLPALAARFEERHGATATEEEAVDISPRRILIVDDKVDVADSSAMVLELKGHSVHVVYRPDAALEAVRSQIPDIVLFDIGLPGMDGYELAGRLREIADGEAMVIVAITGYGPDHDRAKQAGIDAHLIKPVDFNQLQRVLNRLLKPPL